MRDGYSCNSARRGRAGRRWADRRPHNRGRLPYRAPSGLVEATLPSGPAQPPQHVHHEHEEVFIVTAGQVRFTSGDDDVVPIRVPHTFSNPFQEQAVFIGTMVPDVYIQYLRDLRQLPLDHLGMLNPEDI